MAGANEVLLVRHGETDDNAAARFQGRIDTPLNDRGREQSRALAGALAGEGLRALYSSPLARARETAEIVGEQLGLALVLDPRLMEADAGAWSGMLSADIIAADADAFAAWRARRPGFRFPGGESVEEQDARVAAALLDVAAGPLPALVVTHGGAIRAVEGLELPGGSVPNCALFRVPAPLPTTS
ncbi:MAG: 2,3-bisphosphoglycerate-dependent phosphoglycerate mutase [Frankiaceae bacterium]|nr:2,3-bisphosphoglycerate-dependent phosphoglycerate mutase [Frankiaceae bacterium]